MARVDPLLDVSSSHFTLDPALSFQNSLFHRLLEYWHGKRGARLMPSRADIDPLEMPEHLGWIMLTEVVRSSEAIRYRYRLIGSKITHLIGRDSTGKYWDELYAPELYDATTSALRWVVAHRRPLRILGTLKHLHRDWTEMESVDLPLSTDGETVNMILSRPTFR